MNIIELIENKLNELEWKVEFMSRSKIFPSLTFSIIDESGQEFGDGKEIATKIPIQIDIWSQNTKYVEIAKKVKQKMKEINMYRYFERTFFEDNTKIYHHVMRFNYLKYNESEE